MRIRSIQKQTVKSPAELARIRALREKYKERPAPRQLLAKRDYADPVPLGVYLKIKQLMHELKKARTKANLSLSDLARRTAIDRAYLSKLENMQQPNTTLETVSRIAAELGLEVRLAPARPERRRRAQSSA